MTGPAVLAARVRRRRPDAGAAGRAADAARDGGQGHRALGRATGRTSSSASCWPSSASPRRPAVADPRDASATGEPLEIVCGATNIAAGQRVPVALPGAVLPGDRRIERTEKMGVVSNGMLCSGDELRPDRRRRRDPDPARRHADRLPLADLSATPSSTSTSSRTAATPCRSSGSPARSRRSPAPRCACPTTDVAGEPGRRRPTACPSRSPTRPVPAVRRPLGRAASPSGRRPIGSRCGCLPPAMRPISNVVDASNYVMLELGKPIHTFDARAVHDGRPSSSGARRPGERLETLDHVVRELDPETLVIADPAGRSGSPASWAARTSEVSDATTERHRRVGHLRPGQHPPDRIPLRPPVRGEPPLREGPGAPPRPPRRRPDGAPHRRVGRRPRRAAASSTPNPTSRRRRGRVPPGAGQPAARARSSRADEQRALLARVGIETEPAAGDAGSRSPPARSRSTSTRRRRRGARGDRPDLAPRPRDRGRHHRGGRPRPWLRARARTLPDTPMPPYRHDPLELRDPIRETLAGAGLTEVVTYALVSPRMVERFPRRDDDGPPSTGSREPGGPAGRGHQPALQPALGPAPEPPRQPARGRLDEPPPRPRRRRDLRDRQGLRRARRPATHEWWRLGFALTGAAEPPAWDRPARPYDLDDAKGVIELIAAASASTRRVRPLTDDPNLHPGRVPPGSRPAAGSWAGSGSSIRRSLDELDLRADASSSRSSPSPVWPAASSTRAARRAVPPSRPSSATSRSSSPTTRPPPTSRPSIRRHGGPLLRHVALFDIYRGAR